MTTSEPLKPLFWIGDCKKDLKEMPTAIRKTFGFALYQAQLGGRHRYAKALKGFGGAGVLELVDDFRGNAYRLVYTVKFAGAVYALHAFQKKSKKEAKTPRAEIDLIRTRLKAAEERHAQWRTKQEEKEEGGKGDGRAQ